jgi:hypothetical protein
MLLLRHPYFTRVWIIQEIALSPELDIACGRELLSFAEFTLAVFGILASKLGGKNAAHLSHIMTIRSLLMSERNGVADLPYYFARIARNELWLDRNILTLLTLFRRSEATVDVDKVYSLLGLGEEIESGSTYRIRAVYSKHDLIANTEAAFIGVARRILSHQNSLRLFGVINRDRKPHVGFMTLVIHRLGVYIGVNHRTGMSAVLLPSWVPDWSDRSDCGTVMMPLAHRSATAWAAYNFAALNHKYVSSVFPYLYQLRITTLINCWW